MRKKRTISIKNPCLREIRNQLRNLLFTAVDIKIHIILDKKGELKKTEGFWDSNHPDYKRLHKETQKLSSQQNDLHYALRASIAFCPVCREGDKDMTYNPVSKKWFCIECYKFNQEFETRQGRPELYP